MGVKLFRFDWVLGHRRIEFSLKAVLLAVIVVSGC